ncbi:MAG TPA: hypothetical protein VHX61_17640 [Rhizomicrobium sp.]|nr:hypothetical protein [Rhizomicrobium sp.]
MPRATAEYNRRRALSAGAVLLLHLALLATFLVASRVSMRLPNALRELEFTFAEPARNPRPLPSAALQPRFLKPVATAVIAPPALSFVPQSGAAAPAPGAIPGIGRALFGCDPAKLDLLSPETRAACARLPLVKPREQSVRLGPPPDPNSPFTREIEERFHEAVPINRPCALDSYNDTLGLPCFSFDHQAPQLPQR